MQDQESDPGWPVKTFLVILALSLGASAELPDAPYMSATTVHNSVSYSQQKPSRNLDWRFITAHGIYGASLAFDMTLTKIGTSHGCAEANGALGKFPSTGRIVGYGLAEFGAITTMDYLFKRTHIPALSYIGASIGTFKHVSGGREWLQQGGCL